MAPQRLVRLTLNQSANAVRVLLGDTAANAIVTALDLANSTQAFFPPLNSPREGVSIIPGLFQKIDTMATTASQYVRDNFAAVTNCAATDDACAQAFVLGLAGNAFRRPLDDREKTSLGTVYTEVKAAGGTVQEGVQYAVQAVLSSPQFLYRTEFGDASKMAKGGIPLTSSEMANVLSFFLYDGPPDQGLLAAANQGKLTTIAGINAEVDRLLGSAGVQTNLSFAMFTFFKLHLLDNVIIDPTKVPEFTMGLENAMYREGQEFLADALWKGVLDDLILSKSTFVNSDLATKVYGIPVPTNATQTSFVKAELPADQRSGMLTLAPFITSRARTDVGSVVARGLVVDETVLCQIIPPPPESLASDIASAKMRLANETQKAQANFRDTTSPCSGCHAYFDPYGLVLENYDVIGRYRTMDEQGRPVDPTTVLPPDLGGGPIANAVEMAQKLAASGAFTTCMAKSLMQYALSDTTSAPVDTGSNEVAVVATRYKDAKALTFPAMVKQVAASDAIACRSQGGN